MIVEIRDLMLQLLGGLQLRLSSEVDLVTPDLIIRLLDNSHNSVFVLLAIGLIHLLLLLHHLFGQRFLLGGAGLLV